MNDNTKMNTPLISIVSPEYRGEKMVSELVRRIKESVSTITEDFEIILVNDASPDNTWAEIEKECAADSRVKGLDLSRNFGQHYAITAGLHYAKGEWVVVMDCDLQDRPEEIPNLYKKAMEGWDVVFAQRIHRKDGFFKKMSSSLFHRFFYYLTGMNNDKTIANFGIYNIKVIKSVLSMGDSVRDMTKMVLWVGYKTAYLPVEHSKRFEGSSSYSLIKLLRLATDFIIGYSNKPLLIVLKFGFAIFIITFLIALYFLICYLANVTTVTGFTTIVLSIWMIGGIQIMIIGVVGLYIAKIFDNTKNRPLYVVDKAINLVI